MTDTWEHSIKAQAITHHLPRSIDMLGSSTISIVFRHIDYMKDTGAYYSWFF